MYTLAISLSLLIIQTSSFSAPFFSSSITKEQRIALKRLNNLNNKKRKQKGRHRIEKKDLLRSKNYFVGKHKWLGGCIDSKTGIIYGIPSDSGEVICIHPPNQVDDDEAKISNIPLPMQHRDGKFKWLRGIIANNHLYGIPAWSTAGVLKADLKESVTSSSAKTYVLPLPNDLRRSLSLENSRTEKAIDRDKWMWHGAGLSKSGIYCIPSNAKRVLKVDIVTDDVTEIGPSFYEGKNKWYGGIVGRDGAIYGIPYTASSVLRIVPETDEVQVIGDFQVGGWKWHGGMLSPENGVIYGFPAHSDVVLCIDTNIANCEVDDNSWRVSTIPIEKHKDDNDSDDLRYKWLGGGLGADGCIYGMPSDATSILRIDPKTGKATTFGKVSRKKNKFQGGVLSPKDKSIYAMPADSDVVLKIDTNPDTPPTIEYVPLPLLEDGNSIGVAKDTEDKFQGGFLAQDGNIYGICENSCRVMKLIPGDKPRVEFL